jgi:NAD(P)-dependent dehydrogenase (short-subunit alcohol dehydrogenase family)
VEDSSKKITARVGAPYGLFANAGIEVGGLIHKLPHAEVAAGRGYESHRHLLVVQALHPASASAKIQGSIVCSSSTTGFVALADGGGGAYSTTKGGLVAYSLYSD